jgi:hypothetical protein
MSGAQGAEDPPQTYPFAARAGHCYRAYGLAGEGIADLDVVVADSAQILVAQDSTADARAVTPADGAICFKRDDDARVIVSVGMGRGSYAVQVWSD